MENQTYLILVIIGICFRKMFNLPTEASHENRGNYIAGHVVELLEPRPRIAGGMEVTIDEYPYIVSVMLGHSHICGGSIINANFILTAAHCIGQFRKVRVGSSLRTSGGQIYDVSDVHVHPKYEQGRADYDIGLLELELPIVFNDNVRPITLASSDYRIKYGILAVATGWGQMSENGGNSDHLQAVALPLMSVQKCKEFYPLGPLTDRMICAGYDKKGKSVCRNDSGGPLVASGVLVGIANGGRVPCDKYPAVFASVAVYREYIDSIIN